MASLIEFKQTILLLMITFSGLLIMVGFRKTGFGLFVTAILMAIRGPLLMALGNDFINLLPPEFYPYRYIILIGFVCLVSFFLMLRTRFFRSFVKAFCVEVAVDIFYAMLRMPFRVLRWSMRLFFRRNRRIP